MSEESDFSDDSPVGWIQWFTSLEDHQFFCEVSEDFIKQPFNLYGLPKRVKNYKYISILCSKCLEMILRARAPTEDEIEDPQYTPHLPQIPLTLSISHRALWAHTCSLHRHSWGALHHEGKISRRQIRNMSQSLLRKAECYPYRNKLR